MPVLTLDTTQAAKRVGAYSSRTILWWILCGVRIPGRERRLRLKAHRIGEGPWRILASDLADFIREARRDSSKAEKAAKAATAT